MKTASKTAARSMALALAFGAVATTSQALAATKHHHHRGGYGAYARSVEDGAQGESEGGMSAHRTQAIRDCSGVMNRYVQKDWGVTQGTEFASCMAEHGEAP